MKEPDINDLDEIEERFWKDFYQLARSGRLGAVRRYASELDDGSDVIWMSIPCVKSWAGDIGKAYELLRKDTPVEPPQIVYALQNLVTEIVNQSERGGTGRSLVEVLREDYEELDYLRWLKAPIINTIMCGAFPVLEKFGPKVETSESVGELCLACQNPLQVGDYTTFVVLGPGSSEVDRIRARTHQVHRATCVEVHWSCATGRS